MKKIITSVKAISKQWVITICCFFIYGYLHADKYTDLCAYLATVVAQHGNIVHLDTIGKSVQGRNILAIKISDNPAIDENEPELLIEGATHGGELKGHELISPYFIDYL
ncbi:MAG: M14 family zinc carboxypeptidase, partial [Bacteroidota bacterium]